MKALPVSLATLLLTSTALSQPLPEMGELSGRVAESLPSYWTVTDFRQIAASELGDAASPRTVVRFEADVAPTGPLYARVDEQEPFAIVVTTQAEDETRTLYGVMDLSYSAGEWSGDVEVENPVDGLGRPADLFESPTLVMGDPEADERIAQLRAQRETNAVARFEREMNALQNEHESALQELRQENAAELADARNAHVTELAELRSAQEEERRTAEAEHEAALRQLTRDHDAALDEMRADHAETVAALEQEQQALEEELAPQAAREAHANTMSQLRLEHEAELEEIRVAHAEARGALREELNEEIAAAETELQAEVERLQAQLGRSEEAQELQEAFLASVQARSEAALELQQALETGMARRVSIVEQLPEEYAGGVRCQDNDGQVDQSWQLALQFDEVNPSGMRGGVSVNDSYNRPANIVIRSDELTLPLDARISFTGQYYPDHLPSTVDLVISESTFMTGQETVMWNIDNTQKEITCRFEFS